MAENRNQDQDRNRGMGNQQGNQGMQGSDMGNTRSSEGLGDQSQDSDMQQGAGMDRSSVADYGSSGQPLDSGDAGRGGSSGSGRTGTGGMDDMDDEGLGHNRSGAGGM